MSEDQRSSGSKTPWLLWVVTLLGAGVAGWWLWGQLQRAEHDKGEAVDAVTRLMARANECDGKLPGLNDQVAALTRERDDLVSKAAQLSNTLTQREEELSRLTATSKSLEEKLDAEIKRGDVKVTQSEGRIQVDLLDKVLFDSAQAEVSPRGEEVLTRLGAILQGIDDRQIQISGHTDDAPITLPDLKAKFDSNWELSAARAVNVVRFLSEKAQVKPGRLVAAGYGQFRPIATNVTPKGRAANRRIEVLLLPPLEARRAAVPAPPAVPTRK